MQFVRRSKVASESDAAKRIAAFREELSEELSAKLDGGISVYRVDDSTVALIGALFRAPRKKQASFHHFLISEDLFDTFGVDCVSVEGESPFAYMKQRHFEIKSIRDLDGFVAQVAAQQGVTLTEGDIKKRAREERGNPTVTTPEEWLEAGEWTKPIG